MKFEIYNHTNSLKLDRNTLLLIENFNKNYNKLKLKFDDLLQNKILRDYEKIFDRLLELKEEEEEIIFFHELKKFGNDLLLEDLKYFKLKGKKTQEKNIIHKDKFLKGKLSFLSKIILKLILFTITSKLKNNVKNGKFKREDLSKNSGFRIFLMILIVNLEFKLAGVLKKISSYKNLNLHVVGLSLELSIPSKWWEDKNSKNTPKTSYMHFDESIMNPKSIMYLSNVKKQNGPFSILVDSNLFLEPTPIQFLIGRVIGKVGRNDSKISYLFNHKYHQTLGCDIFLKFFNKIPKELKFNSHFGFDVIKGSLLEGNLVKKERVFYGNFGDYFIFDGSETLHRGGLIKEGERLVFQIIFGQKEKNFYTNKILKKLSLIRNKKRLLKSSI